MGRRKHRSSYVRATKDKLTVKLSILWSLPRPAACFIQDSRVQRSDRQSCLRRCVSQGEGAMQNSMGGVVNEATAAAAV